VGGFILFDTLDLCVGDTLELVDSGDTSEVSCDFDGTEEDFTFSCDYSTAQDDTCTVDWAVTGSGEKVGDTFTATITNVGTYNGANCSGTCTATITSTQTRTGPAVCKRNAPARVVLFKLEDLKR
jgi:hypothetical protein